jgi:hypothetical protein
MAPNGAPISVYPCEELPNATVSDGAGGMYIVWTDKRTCAQTLIYVQRVLGSGQVAAGWPTEGLPVGMGAGNQYYPQAVSDGSGGLIVAWQDGRTGKEDMFAQRIAPDGSRLWEPAGVRVCDAAGNQIGLALSPDSHHGAFLAWMDARRGLTDGLPHEHPAYDLYAQRMDANGVRLWSGTGAPVETLAEDYSAPHLVSDGSGGVWVVWVDRRVATYAQRLDSSGLPRLVQDGVAINGGWIGQITSDAASGFILAFEYGSTGDLYVQRVDSTGTDRWSTGGHGLVSVPLGLEPTSILPDGEGGALIAWHDLRNGHDWDVFALRITAAGIASSGWPIGGVPVCTKPNFQIYPQMTSDGAGGCIVSWNDIRDSSSVFDIYAQRVRSNGAIADGWPADGVLLCNAPGDQKDPHLVPDGNGGALLAWSDYRLYADVYAGRVNGAGVVGDSSYIVGVPSGTEVRFALDPLEPNPLVGGALRVRFSLPRAGRAELGVFDVRGRRIALHSFEATQPGPVSLALDGADTLAPGVYVLRLDQAGQSRARKFTVVR